MGGIGLLEVAVGDEDGLEEDDELEDDELDEELEDEPDGGVDNVGRGTPVGSPGVGIEVGTADA